MNNNKDELFDNSTSLFVLSCLMKKPLLIQDGRYVLTKTDFVQPLQQIVFYAVYNMAQQGAEVITPQDIDICVKQYPTQYEYYHSNKGMEWAINTYKITDDCDIDHQFNAYYQRLKKFSILRDLKQQGFDIRPFYDTSKDLLERDQEDEKLNKTPIEAIANYYREKLVEVENLHVGKDNGTSQTAEKGLRALVKDLMANPEVGLPLDGDIVNYATRGARAGKLYVYSAPSGAGKTRYMVGNACAISMPYIDDAGKVIMRDDYQKVLFVATEMTADEIQTLILAYVSGVNEKNILLGNYRADELERIEQALSIIETYKDNFIIECIPDPSMAMIRTRLAKFIVQDGIEYIFYDYIFSSPGLLSEFRDIEVREDVALMMLSNTLKEVAQVYNVFIQSATQLNDGWSKKEIGIRDQNCLRGSKAIADKIDIGMVAVRTPDAEFEKVQGIYNELSAKHPEWKGVKPNMVIDLYKNRRGEISGMKIFRYFDHATCRSMDMFITDSSYNTVTGIGLLEYEKRPRDYLDLITTGELHKCIPLKS